MTVEPLVDPLNKGPIHQPAHHYLTIHEPPGDLMPLEREGTYPDRNVERPRVGVRRDDARMRGIANAIVEGIAIVMGTLEGACRRPQLRCAPRRRVASRGNTIRGDSRRKCCPHPLTPRRTRIVPL